MANISSAKILLEENDSPELFLGGVKRHKTGSQDMKSQVGDFGLMSYSLVEAGCGRLSQHKKKNTDDFRLDHF